MPVRFAVRSASTSRIRSPRTSSWGEFKSGDEIHVTRVEGQDHLTFKATRAGDGGGSDDGGHGPSEPSPTPVAGARGS